MRERQLLFSVTIDDCRVDTFCSGGKGGSHQNATKSGVRITHPPSGAVGEARDSRYQWQNKQQAFRRMAESKAFKVWHKLETSRLLGLLSVESLVEEAMAPKNLKVEVSRNNKWEEEKC